MKTISSCSDVRLGVLVVLEGMPGAGKTTILNRLAAAGDAVLGEYTTEAGETVPLAGHPATADDDAHQLNWVRKASQARPLLACHPSVVTDRDWLSALAYAYSIGDFGLLAARTSWAVNRLRERRLLLGEVYVVFDLDPATSLARRPAAPADHPWSRPEPLRRLRGFYRDPAQALDACDPVLAVLLSSREHRILSGHDPAEANLDAVRVAMTP